MPSIVANDFIGNLSIDPNDDHTLYAAFINYTDPANARPRAWKVTQANTNNPVWINISGDLPPNLPVNQIQVDPNDPGFLYAATDFGLYYSSNGGQNWVKELGIPNVAIQEMRLRTSDRSLFLFTFGRGVWYLRMKADPVNAANIPYCTSFDEDALDEHWTTSSTNSGRIRITDLNGPNTGSHHAVMDALGTTSVNEMKLHMALQGAENVHLSFFWQDFKDETHPEDGVFISDDGGATYTKIYDLTGNLNYVYQKVDLNLSQLIINNGLEHSNDFVLKFQQKDNTSTLIDGIAIDDICIFSIIEPDFCQGFEEGQLPVFMTTSHSLPKGRVQVRNTDGPNSGSYHLVSDVFPDDQTMVTNTIDMHLDLSSINNPWLSFSMKDFQDEQQQEDGIYLSDDGGTTFTRVYSFQNSQVTDNTWLDYQFQLTFWIDKYSLSYSDHFVVRLQHIDNSFTANDGMAFDDICVYDRAAPSPYAPIPYSTGFESGSFDSFWSQISSTSMGRIRVTGLQNPNGSYQAIMDEDGTCGPHTKNELWLQLDLSTAINSPLYFSFKWKEFGDETNSADGVYLSDNGGKTFVKVLDMTYAPYNVFQNVNLYLTGLILQHNLSYSSEFVIKFQQYDECPINTDGIAIDDVDVWEFNLEETGVFGGLQEQGGTENAPFNLFPNPARKQITLETNAETGSRSDVFIFNMQGQKVLERKVDFSTTGRQELNISDLSAGSYLITIVPEIGQRATLKLKVIK